MMVVKKVGYALRVRPKITLISKYFKIFSLISRTECFKCKEVKPDNPEECIIPKRENLPPGAKKGWLCECKQ